MIWKYSDTNWYKEIQFWHWRHKLKGMVHMRLPWLQMLATLWESSGHLMFTSYLSQCNAVWVNETTFAQFLERNWLLSGIASAL